MAVRVTVILATYNAGPFLDPLLESIVGQTWRDWILLARDDGSTDGTAERLALWAERDARITLPPTGDDRLGARRNFGLLAQAALERGAEIVFFADQDDVWHTDKLERLLACFQTTNKPQLVHSDLRVIDGLGNVIAPSFVRHAGLNPNVEPALPVLLVQNFVTGCAMAANQEALKRALPLPQEAVMHDWWLALVTAAEGIIHFVPQPTTDYRRHADNLIGPTRYLDALATTARRWLNPFRARTSGNGDAGRSEEDAFLAVLRQADALANRLPGTEAGRLAREFVALFSPETRGWRRLRGAFRLGIRRQDSLRTLLLYARLSGLAGKPIGLELQPCESPKTIRSP